jgi:hypothetical protein
LNFREKNVRVPFASDTMMARAIEDLGEPKKKPFRHANVIAGGPTNVFPGFVVISGQPPKQGASMVAQSTRCTASATPDARPSPW